MKSMLTDKQLPQLDLKAIHKMISEAVELGVSPQAGFSRVTINEGGMARTIVVVGSPVEIKNKLGIRNLLKG